MSRVRGDRKGGPFSRRTHNTCDSAQPGHGRSQPPPVCLADGAPARALGPCLPSQGGAARWGQGHCASWCRVRSSSHSVPSLDESPPLCKPQLPQLHGKWFSLDNPTPEFQDFKKFTKAFNTPLLCTKHWTRPREGVGGGRQGGALTSNVGRHKGTRARTCLDPGGQGRRSGRPSQLRALVRAWALSSADSTNSASPGHRLRREKRWAAPVEGRGRKGSGVTVPYFPLTHRSGGSGRICGQEQRRRPRFSR